MAQHDGILLVTDSSTGRNLAELPWSNMQRSRVLSGCGQLSCDLPTDHPAVTEENLGQTRASADREVTFFRNGEAVWNGPVSASDCTWGDGAFHLVAREASWYLTKRVLEDDKDYDGWDVFDIVRDLIDYMLTKTSNGDDGLSLGDDIVADIPRFLVDPASDSAGATFSFAASPTIYGTDRKTIQEILDLLAADPELGFEWRMDYTTGSAWQACLRTLSLAYPSFSHTKNRDMTELLVGTLGRTCDNERAGTRVHVMGADGPVTKQSGISVTNGIILLETVDDLTDGSPEMTLARARDLRRLRRPPVHAFTASYIPGDVLAYGFTDLGDTWPFQVINPDILSITADTRRVVQEEVSCDVDGSEEVVLTFNDPLSDLGE